MPMTYFLFYVVPANLFKTYPSTFNFKIDSLGQYVYIGIIPTTYAQ